MMLPKAALSLIDNIDHRLCKLGVLHPASFADLDTQERKALYAGRLSRHLPQYESSTIGMTPYFPSRRNIGFDVTRPLPIPDNSIEHYQSEDVFEHIEYGKLRAVFDEIFRVLKPGGLFRLSVPDYRFDQYRDRSQRDASGAIVFDPGGGGAYRDGKVVDGGHLWFPTYELVKALFDESDFGTGADVRFLQYTAADGSFVVEPLDPKLGYVQRSAENDARVADRPRPISIVVDAIKK